MLTLCLQKRVEIMSAPGLPLTITEFSVHSYDVMERARAIEEAFYVYFSQRSIQAIMLWGFSDLSGYHFVDDMFLTTGETFTVRVVVTVVLLAGGRTTCRLVYFRRSHGTNYKKTIIREK